jgi:hypothetical protein
LADRAKDAKFVVAHHGPTITQHTAGYDFLGRSVLLEDANSNESK